MICPIRHQESQDSSLAEIQSVESNGCLSNELNFLAFNCKISVEYKSNVNLYFFLQVNRTCPRKQSRNLYPCLWILKQKQIIWERCTIIYIGQQIYKTIYIYMPIFSTNIYQWTFIYIRQFIRLYMPIPNRSILQRTS